MNSLRAPDEKPLASLLANLPGMAFRCRFDPDWTVEFVSQGVEDLTGYTVEEFTRQPPLLKPADLVHPEDRARMWEAVLQSVRDRTSYTIEYRIHTRSGEQKWVGVRGTARFGADGRAQYLEGFNQDISARKHAEEELRASERLRRLVIDTGPECVKVVAADGHLLQMNAAGLKMLEVLSLEQAQERPLLDFVAPNHREPFVAMHKRVLGGENAELEFEVIGLRGTRRWLETHAVPLRDENGVVMALLGITRDVTERREQRERIARLSRMRSVMSSINALIVRTRSRTELFQEACRIAVEQGGFALAWIGVVRDDEIVPVAHHGDDGGHLEGLRQPLRVGAQEGCDANVKAVHDGRPQVCNSIADDTGSRWRGALQELGFQSKVSYPLLQGGRAAATLNLYSREAGLFDDDEMKLLAELVRDLVYALEFIIKDETLDFLAIYDPLTRLPNRALFMQRLPLFVEDARATGRRMALVMLDIERFKAINDAFGHAGGDELLKLVGDRLKVHAGGPRYMARIAGDRFAAVVSEIDRDEDVEALIKGGGWDRLDAPFRHGDNEFPVTFKVGVAVFPQDAADADALLRDAELALKHGKASGRGVTRYTAAMGEVAARKLGLERQLRRALERDEFRLYYQPKLDLRTGHICGAEALLRWQNPDGTLVPPDVLIPLMEETGLILDVGQWALRKAVADRADWLAAGLPAPRVAVNISSAQVREAGFVAAVRAAAGNGLGEGLELEVTESMMMADTEASVVKLRELRAAGVTISLDDFGTGYSSLAYLARLPLNSVKIDRSFIARMVDTRDTLTIVGAIVSLAHSMNLKVIAEGVETAEQLRLLHVLRCDEFQGFLFSEAVPSEKFAALLASGRKAG